MVGSSHGIAGVWSSPACHRVVASEPSGRGAGQSSGSAPSNHGVGVQPAAGLAPGSAAARHQGRQRPHGWPAPASTPGRRRGQDSTPATQLLRVAPTPCPAYVAATPRLAAWRRPHCGGVALTTMPGRRRPRRLACSDPTARWRRPHRGDPAAGAACADPVAPTSRSATTPLAVACSAQRGRSGVGG